jgi:hypothetical protein
MIAVPGTTYWSVSQETGVSVSAIEAANPWPATGIPVGANIVVPGNTGNYTPPANTQPQTQQSYSAPQTPAQPQNYSSPSQTASVPSSGGWSNEQAIIQAESGGNPTAVNPSSGASGLFQDLPSTWNDYDGYSSAGAAPVSVQIQFNQALHAQDGSSPWAGDGAAGE